MANGRTFEQEGRAVAGNHRAMWGTCIENLHLISGNTVNRKNTETIGIRQTWRSCRNTILQVH